MLMVCDVPVVQAVVMLAEGVTHGVITVKTEVLVAVPFGVVIAMVPEVAPDGTVNTIVLELVTLKTTVTPFNFTEVAPVKFVPLTVTVVPTGPLEGVNEVMVGTGAATQLKVEAQPAALVVALLTNLKVSCPPVAVEVIAAGILVPVRAASNGDVSEGPL